VIVRMAEDGQVLGVDQAVTDPVEFSMAMAKAGPDPRSGPRKHLRLVLSGRGE
jgi:hypothetical protein